MTYRVSSECLLRLADSMERLCRHLAQELDGRAVASKTDWARHMEVMYHVRLLTQLRGRLQRRFDNLLDVSSRPDAPDSEFHRELGALQALFDDIVAEHQVLCAADASLDDLKWRDALLAVYQRYLEAMRNFLASTVSTLTVLAQAADSPGLEDRAVETVLTLELECPAEMTRLISLLGDEAQVLAQSAAAVEALASLRQEN